LPHYARFEATNGATFSLSQQDDLPTGNGVTVYFELENLDEYVESLVQSGFQFDELPNDKSYLWREARLKDLDGNKVILYYAGENRLNPPWKIN
jgi:predicted enzyme related to lactoylglutathione lyase